MRIQGLIAVALATISCNSVHENITKPDEPVPSFQQPIVIFSTNSITISFPTISLPPDKVIEGTFEVEFGPAFGNGVHVTRIWSFIGVDQGDLGEFSVDVSAPERVYQRSMHKETLSNYEAWEYLDVNFTTKKLSIHVLGHMTGKPGNLQIELILETTRRVTELSIQNAILLSMR